MEINTKKNEVTEIEDKNKAIKTLLNNKAQETNDVKTAIDILATRTALEQDGTVEKIVTEKTTELKNNAEAKRVQAEKERIEEEVNKIRVEKEKVLAELDKQIGAKQKEIEQIDTEKQKAKAYFDACEHILKYVGIRNPLTLKSMQAWMKIASIIHGLFQIILLPLTLIGAFIEGVINIIGSVCGEIKNNGLKIILSVVIGIIVVGLVALAYIYGGRLIATLFN